jgi:hypothetical protein
MLYGQKEQFFLFWPVRGKGDAILPATGQARCYDAKGQPISWAGSGQDVEFRLGVRWPDPRFEEAGSLVVDRLTNLVSAKASKVRKSRQNGLRTVERTVAARHCR